MEIYQGMSPVDLATRLVNVLVTEQRESTYKEAFVVGLIQECADGGEPEFVSLLSMANRFIDLYWQQLNAFPSDEILRQVRKGDQRIPSQILNLKGASVHPKEWRPGKPRTSSRYQATQKRIAQLIAQLPATHLQNPGGLGGSNDFIFDSSWLWDKVTIKVLDLHDWRLKLLPGAREALLETESLLIPVVQRMWEQDLMRFNSSLQEDRRLTDFLFGDDRIGLGPVRLPLQEAQGAKCFYCGTKITDDFHVDHVVPWSRSGLNDLANLVAVDKRCNLAKSDALPTPEVVCKAVNRGYLSGIAAELEWELDPSRVDAVAVRLLSAAPEGTRLWGMGRLWVVKGATNRAFPPRPGSAGVRGG